MGIYESKGNNNLTGSPQTGPVNETVIPGHTMVPIKSIVEVAKSICKIITPNQLGSGFFIKFFKRGKDFYCLMTNEHLVTKEMIANNKNKIEIYYDNEKKYLEIFLNSKERFIKDFRDKTIDATVIEILPKDNIPNDYFLLTLLDYRDNYDKLKGKDIAIIQYPQGEMYYADGNIIERTSLEKGKYEFSHNASTKGGSSGSPIFLKGITKVIGIHKGGSGNENIKIKYGDFIWPIFCYFKNFEENNNEIPMKKELVYKNNNNSINYRNNIIPINNLNNSNFKNDYGLIKKNYSNKEKLNQITIIYEIKSYEDSMGLFGDDFVKNNINNCYLLIDGRQIKLCKDLTLGKNQKNKNILEIKLIETNKITNMSHMFSLCSSLNSYTRYF